MLTNGLASQMLAVAIGWQVYEIHHNPFDLGLVGLMEFVPLPVLALPAGQVADRLPRRAVTAASYVLTIGIAVALIFVTLAGAHRLWPYLVLAGVAGIASVVGNPAARAITREIVPEEMIANAMALRSVAGQIGIVAGPALGGVIFSVEPVAVYAVAAGLLGISFIAVIAMGPAVASFVTTEAPDVEGATARFVALEDGSLLLEEGDGDLTQLADAIEQEVSRPYRAIAVRRGETQWAVAAHRLQVIELPEPGGDEVELAVRGDERTLVIDGNRAFGTLPELEALATGDAVVRGARLDGNVWEVRVDPL